MKTSHEKLAIASFIFVILLATGSFYYIWKAQTGYGKTIEGVHALAQIWEERKAREAQRPTNIQDFSAQNGCCIHVLSSPGRTVNTKIDIRVQRRSGGMCLDHLGSYLQEKIDKGEMYVDLIEEGPCMK